MPSPSETQGAWVVDATPLRVVDLSVSYRASGGLRRAVRSVSFSVGEGKVCGVVGESGSGKTTLGLAALGLLPRATANVEGSVWLGSLDLVSATPRQLRGLLGSELALIPQNPMTALTPVLTIGYQFREAIRAHERCSAAEAQVRAIDALAATGVAGGRRVLGQYPHQVSGGTAQRIVIALALINRPRVVIADEPTSALDTPVQRQILQLLQRRVTEDGVSLVLISHDFGVIAALSDQVIVMYRGMDVESGSADQVLTAPAHPYTRALLAAAEGKALPRAPEPAIVMGAHRCEFVLDCPCRLQLCGSVPPPLNSVTADHRARCHLVPITPGDGK